MCVVCKATDPDCGYYASDRTCKDCRKAKVRANRAAKIEYYRAYDRARGHHTTQEQDAKYRKENPEKYKAHYTVSNALRDGRLFKPTECSICHDMDCQIEGHHDDYSQPLEVRWVCSSCHSGIHNGTVI